MIIQDRRKRERSLSSTSSSSSISQDDESSRHATQSPTSSPKLKHHKLDLASFAASSIAPNVYTCSSAPVCDKAPMMFSTPEAIQAHHVRCHLYVCDAATYYSVELPGRGQKISAWQGRACGKVFPNERLLSLHNTECHDVARKQRQNDGKKIFGCFLPRIECTKVCSCPKTRRLHMINVHQYPKQFYYGIVLHGLNRLLHNEGPGASMLRPLPANLDTDEPKQSKAMSKTLGPGSNLPPVLPKHPRNGTEDKSGDAVAGMIDGMAALAFVPRKVKAKERAVRGEEMVVDTPNQ